MMEWDEYETDFIEANLARAAEARDGRERLLRERR